MRINLRIPSPFALRELREQAEPELDPLDIDVPLGLHPMIDFVRFTMALMRNQLELAKLVEEQNNRLRSVRWGLVTLYVASVVATICQAAQIWVNWR